MANLNACACRWYCHGSCAVNVLTGSRVIPSSFVNRRYFTGQIGGTASASTEAPRIFARVSKPGLV